jgi:HlyD family secretion protein
MKRKRIITIIVVSIIVLGGATAGTLYSMGVFGGSKATTASYTVEKLTTGDIEKSIDGTGTLTAGGTSEQTVPVDLTIGTVSVKVGQAVKTGDTIATIDAQSIADTIAALQSDISTIDSDIARQASSASVSKLTSSVSGRVEKILCSVGSDVEDTMMASEGLFLLSTDGKMKIEVALDTAGSVAAGDKVKVKTGGKTYTGLVENVATGGASCTVTITDYGTTLGADATVYNTSKVQLGTGKLEINRPYLVPATAGTVSKIYVTVGKKVSSRTSLAYLTGIPTSDAYNQLVASRAEKVALLKTALELQKSGCIKASCDGTVKSVNAMDSQAVTLGGSIASLLTTESFSLDVSVDELDINNVSVGQTASLAIDAITDKTFEGTVESVSQIGVTSNGVTNYTVVINVASDALLKVGMNATATIVIEKHTGVLLMPISALNTMMGKSYVWLYTGSLPTDSSQNPGTRTEVTTGLSNDNYVEIASGLTADDQVVVVRTKSTTGSSNNSSQSGFFGMEGMTGGNFPSGGERPSGGFPGGN